MSILVTGGAGYIGSHAVFQLIGRNLEVVVVDNLQSGNMAAVHPDATFYKGDIRDSYFMRNIFSRERIDSVIHFSAHSLVGDSIEKPLAYFDNNVHGTQVLLQTMAEFGVDKLVFSSTAAVYGEPEFIPIKEEMETNPTNPYGETKLAVEKMMHWCEQAYGIRFVSLRYFNVAGARESSEIGEDHRPETHLIPIVLEVALNQRPYVTIFGNDYNTADGTCIRDYIHVEDLVDAHILALNYLDNGGKSNIFNLGNNDGFSVKEIIKTARSITGKEIPEKLGKRRAGDPSSLVANAEKASVVLGWQPARPSIEKIINDAWNWHVHHPHGYKKDVMNP